MSKPRVAILFGGQSAEHEVSILSATTILKAINRSKYDPVLIGIDKTGVWWLFDDLHFLLDNPNPNFDDLSTFHPHQIALLPGGKGEVIDVDNSRKLNNIDVAFPILHGPFGEDGTVQGLLKIAEVPFVGAGVLGSAISMDKDVMKRLLRDSGIPVAQFVSFRKGNICNYQTIVDKLGDVVFVKPANMGSSVGISKVKNEEEYRKAITLAFEFDSKVIVEECIVGRELECSVLGSGDNPIASLPGEIIPQHEFYSYDAKYNDDNGAKLEIPAKLDEKTTKKVQDMAIKTFQVLECDGLGRVDFFLRPSGELLVNEINTIPGFTSISMYPKLWEYSGISIGELVDRLINSASIK